uniref:Uncharacterized protein n=1 Tax=Romanomermis culicivorax TaxID=13658 RepID=A0A915J5C2_ROMCU
MTVDGDGYVPKKSVEYCQILQQGADGDRVHVKPIKGFHHFVQRVYDHDHGTTELMNLLNNLLDYQNTPGQAMESLAQGLHELGKRQLGERQLD